MTRVLAARILLFFVLAAGVRALQLPLQPASRPAFLDRSWWEPETAADVETADVQTHRAIEDPCWWNQDECEVDGAVLPTRAPAVELTQEQLERVLPVMPCVTTDEGCDLESGAAVTMVDAPAAPAEYDVRFIDPCFWDDGCLAGPEA